MRSLILSLALAGCAPDEIALPGAPEAPAETESEGVWSWDLPDGFPSPAVPEDNPMTPEKVELGRYLFYDRRLSGNGTQACSDCHLQELAFTDDRALPEGSTGELGVRNSMGLANTAYHSTLTWANPVLLTFEQQILVPLFGEFPVELGITGHEDEVLERFASDADYQARFEAAFPERPADERISWDPIVDALSSFMRALVSFRTPFDDWTYRDDDDAMTEQELRGLELFFSERLECHHCHGGPLFAGSFDHENTSLSERPFFNTGLYNIDDTGDYPPDNPGLFTFTSDPWDMGRFRPPGLRNLAYTAPYMHDGSIATLEEVIEHYEAGGRTIEDGPYAGDGSTNPYKSPFVTGFELTDAERADLVAFLRDALADESLVTDPALSDPFR